MAKVKDVMSHNIPRVNSWATVLEASKAMNRNKASAAVIVEGDKVLGMLGERGLLRKIVPLNKRPEEVRVGELMVPLLKIEPEASTKKRPRNSSRADTPESAFSKDPSS